MYFVPLFSVFIVTMVTLMWYITTIIDRLVKSSVLIILFMNNINVSSHIMHKSNDNHSDDFSWLNCRQIRYYSRISDSILFLFQ